MARGPGGTQRAAADRGVLAGIAWTRLAGGCKTRLSRSTWLTTFLDQLVEILLDASLGLLHERMVNLMAGSFAAELSADDTLKMLPELNRQQHVIQGAVAFTFLGRG